MAGGGNRVRNGGHWTRYLTGGGKTLEALPRWIGPGLDPPPL